MALTVFMTAILSGLVYFATITICCLSYEYLNTRFESPLIPVMLLATLIAGIFYSYNR